MRSVMKSGWGFFPGSLIAMGLGIAGATAANAAVDPAGCTGNYPSFTVGSDGLLKASGTATCNRAVTRTWRVEIKQDIERQPDPLVAANIDRGSKTRYSAKVQSCDSGSRGGIYYARTFFTETKKYRDSGHWKNVDTC